MQQKFYFPIHPACNYIPSKEKHAIEHNITRDNDNEKKLDIIKQKDE